MTFKQYLTALNAIAQNNPKSLDYEVIYAIDEEGNGFNLLELYPTIGHYNGDPNTFESRNDDLPDDSNVICIN